MPPGLALDRNTGVLSGTPTTMGLKSFALGLTVAGYSGEATRPLSFEIDDFSFAYATNTALVTTATVVSLTPALNDGVSNTSGQTGSLGLLGRHNGTRGSLIPTGATTTYSILTGAMPPGVSLNAATGVISGTPMATGVFDFKVKLTVTFEGASVDAVDSPGQTMRITVS